MNIRKTLYAELVIFLLVSACVVVSMVMPLMSGSMADILVGIGLILLAATVILSGLVTVLKSMYYEFGIDNNNVGEKARTIFERFDNITDAIAEKANNIMHYVIDVELVVFLLISTGIVVSMVMPLMSGSIVDILVGIGLILLAVIVMFGCMSYMYKTWNGHKEK